MGRGQPERQVGGAGDREATGGPGTRSKRIRDRPGWLGEAIFVWTGNHTACAGWMHGSAGAAPTSQEPHAPIRRRTQNPGRAARHPFPATWQPRAGQGHRSERPRPAPGCRPMSGGRPCSGARPRGVGGAGLSFTILNPQREICLMKRSPDHQSGGSDELCIVGRGEHMTELDISIETSKPNRRIDHEDDLEQVLQPTHDPGF